MSDRIDELWEVFAEQHPTGVGLEDEFAEWLVNRITELEAELEQCEKQVAELEADKDAKPLTRHEND